MGWIKELEAFWTSEAGINFYNNLAIVGFWIGIPLTLLLIWPLLLLPGRKLTKRITQIEKDIHSPGMEDIRNFFKPLCRKLGIDTDDKQHERN